MEGSNMSHFSFMHYGEKENTSAVFSAQKGSSSHLLPIFAMLQPPALSQKHSPHSTTQWKTSLTGTKAGQHNL